jgi:hypothetical protein
MPAGKHHVPGFYVAVKHAGSVRGSESISNFAKNAYRFRDRKRTAAIHSFAEALSFHERHCIEEKPFRLAGIEQRKDVGMLKARENPDLARKPVRPEGGGELRPQDFHRNLSIVLQVLGQIDRRHASRTQLTLDGIAVRKRGAK